MRKWLYLAMGLAVLVSVAGLGVAYDLEGAATPTPAEPLSYPIKEAVAQGLIEVEIEGRSDLTEACAGDIIEIGFQRRQPQVMEIVIPAGTVLTNTNASQQNMVIRGLTDGDLPSNGNDTLIVLDEDGWQRFLFEAYCLEMSKDNIRSSSSFALGEEASVEVVSVLDATDEVGADIATLTAIQAALWALTENATREQICGRIDAGDTDIDCACKILDAAGFAGEAQRLRGGSA
jgi:hypothetical protein